MKLIKRIALIIFILVTAAYLFRGPLYRLLITYKSIGTRTNYPATNKKLVGYIQVNSDSTKDITAIIKQSLSITSHQLCFTATKNDIDPNKLIDSKTAHCVGYAAFFATTCNYLLQKNDLSDQWIAQPRVGQLYLLGININHCINKPFYKDHDFVTIENRNTGETFAVDPTVNDYFNIDFIKYKY
jgi:hypothetical protein